jgi:hypothetical protein
MGALVDAVCPPDVVDAGCPPDRSFNFSFRYIYDVLSLNYSKLGDYVNLYDLTLRIPYIYLDLLRILAYT